ncbi:MAG: arginyltransferase [Spirochaetae bacterium HGW-Spirochaetae-1]|jgi:arginine-tRNA-protein transferase|nr:MAG: arginyltransferase [Spirochaetae bacterium HGW-Spirochaetae-1]
MILIQKPQISTFSPCAYLPDREWRFEYFFAMDLNEGELEELLARGWRKFGAYFFRPQCGECRECIPIRVRVSEFNASRSHRRILKKGSDIAVKFGPLEYRDEIYEIYRIHSLDRFGRETDRDEFISSFYTRSCPSLQSEYFINEKLAAVGFLDKSGEALSSVYFVFDTTYGEYRLGSLSILKEIEQALTMNLKYYYLGYYIRDNHSMAYKNLFHLNEKYDWLNNIWSGEKSR